MHARPFASVPTGSHRLDCQALDDSNRCGAAAPPDLPTQGTLTAQLRPITAQLVQCLRMGGSITQIRVIGTVRALTKICAHARSCFGFCVLVSALILTAAGNALAQDTSPSLDTLIVQAEAARSADPASFDSLLQQLDNRSQEGTAKQREEIRYLNAYHKSYSGDFKGAIADLHDLFNYATDNAVRFKAAAFLVNNYALTRQFAEGLVLLDGMLALVPQIDDPSLRQQGLGVAALMYIQVGQYQPGLEIAHTLLAENPSERIRCFASSLAIEAQFNLNTLPQDDSSLHQAIEQCLKNREMVAASSIRVFLARKWLMEGKRSRALKLLESSLSDTESTRYPLLISGVHSLLATLYLGSEDVTRAERSAQKSIDISAGNAFAQPVVDAYKVLYDIALARGDTSAALERYRKYAEADKAYLNDVKAREIAYQLARQETTQKNQTIALLNKQNEVLRLQQQVTAQEAQNARLRLIVVAGLLIFVLGSVVFWGIKVKRLQVSLRRLAEIDTLTGVCNRHHFTQCAEGLLGKAKRADDRAALIIFDLDHFKNINDNHGHPAGDLVLRHATAMCEQHIRDGDLIGRLGGEEFAILLLGCDAQAASQVAEDCRRHLADLRVQHEDGLMRITGSFGVSCTEISGYSLKTLVSHADKALYEAKRGGRNRVNIHAAPA